MNSFVSFLSRNKSGILMGVGIGSMIMSTISAFRMGPMAKEAIEDKKKEQKIEELEPKDVIKTTIPYIIMPLSFSVIGVGCIIGANQINVNSGAAAVAAYTLSETAFREYRDQTRQIVGEKKEKDIREAVAKDVLERNPISQNQILLTGKGDCLCFDDVANQYFRSNKTSIEKIINKLNFEMMNSRTEISVNDYCLAMGLEPVLLGNDLGWTVDGSGIIQPDIIVQERNNEPCFVITHARREPKPFY